MKKLNILLLLSCLLGCFSCDDFLAETPSDELTPESTQAFSELLLYEGYLPSNQQVSEMLPFLDDDIASNYPYSEYAFEVGYDEEAMEKRLYYTWQPRAVDEIMNSKDGGTSSTASGCVPWQSHFKCILGCNIVLANVDESIGMEIDKSFLKGEALCLRAFHYFQLVNLYGWPYNDKKNDPKTSLGVPIVTNPEIGVLSVARNTVDEVYALIVEDIENSVKYFDEGKKEMNHKYRVSPLVAHLLASRIYLYMENWDKALEHAKVVMEQKELCDYTQGMPESIFTAENDDILWMFGKKEDVCALRETASMSSAFVGSYAFYENFENEEWTDCRAAGFFEVSRDSVFETGYDPETYEPFKNLVSTSVTVAVKKYLGVSEDYTRGLRVTEAYLNAIEALLGQYKEGNTQAGTEALRQLNNFRAKRYLTTSGSPISNLEMKSADELIEIYRLERRKELCYEGHRWFDLRRFGMPRLEKHWMTDEKGNYEKYVLEEHDPLYVLEIPAYVLNLNPGLQPNETLSSPRIPVNL